MGVSRWVSSVGWLAGPARSRCRAAGSAQLNTAHRTAQRAAALQSNSPVRALRDGDPQVGPKIGDEADRAAAGAALQQSRGSVECVWGRCQQRLRGAAAADRRKLLSRCSFQNTQSSSRLEEVQHHVGQHPGQEDLNRGAAKVTSSGSRSAVAQCEAAVPASGSAPRALWSKHTHPPTHPNLPR